MVAERVQQLLATSMMGVANDWAAVDAQQRLRPPSSIALFLPPDCASRAQLSAHLAIWTLVAEPTPWSPLVSHSAVEMLAQTDFPALRS